MKERRTGYKWTKEACEIIAKKYATRTEFSVRDATTYRKAKENGWLDDVTKHMYNPNRKDIRNKPKMILNIRISNDEAGNQRYTNNQIISEIKKGNVNIELSGGNKVPLLIRKKDGAVLGEIL
jgi:hypothetical protein